MRTACVSCHQARLNSAEDYHLTPDSRGENKPERKIFLIKLLFKKNPPIFELLIFHRPYCMGERGIILHFFLILLQSKEKVSVCANFLRKI